ncbi:MAG TPA: RtcB family protein [Fimbriimonadaceae bacterium]|nr:RNA-splicing ligase RtcB [Armatimonadota bacterium]HRD30182.1 RtcB family protein [Fimbriimonadaceae bacterium]HRE94469.1 RtcB family protein [Fimbriimonadaceae bacterium]HRI74475.1 RtcB family protein [Fimbriimonadaceae bacterium]
MDRNKLHILGEHDEGTLKQMRQAVAADECAYGVLCADGHKGYNVPIGAVLAYPEHISPAGVGFDIACGNKAVRLDLKASEIRPRLNELAEQIFASLSFGVGRVNQTKIDHPAFDSPTWKEVPFLRTNQSLFASARNQLGTIGSGNHYVDVFEDQDTGNVWVGCHFGSRGLGHRIASHFIEASGAKPNGNMDSPPTLLDVNSEVGQEYIAAMHLAGDYAYAGRDWVCEHVAAILGGTIQESVHNHHNFAWQEEHHGQTYWVVRKGATPAFPGQRGFVGGSMGDVSVILRGTESLELRQALCSTVHGAGRVMSRTAAAGKKRWVKDEAGRRQAVQISEGVVNMPAVREDLARRGIVLKGAGADEAPEVYKNLPTVLQHHVRTIQVTTTLTPLIVCMAGSDEFDPYKD